MVLMVALFLLSTDLVAESVLSCGTRSSDYPPAKWPFHVGLFAMDLPNQEHYFCGGTLVGDRTVLTAAHCVIGYRTTQSTSKPLLTVHVGKYELYNPTRNNGTKYHVAAVVIHPEYNVESLTNDVAVLQLVKRVEFSRVVQPACLWPANATSLDDIPGTVATAVGWGMDVNERFSNVLTERTHPVALKKECEKQFGASFLRSMGEDSIMCARTSVCAGSGGSGLYLEQNGRMFLRGIVTFGPKTGNGHRCGVNTFTAFANIALYTTWIQQQQEDNSTLETDHNIDGQSAEVD
ncbi:chymotrypsinogen 2 [Culex quinquefasciatus]|uniref:chymotrypsinogen 2 n=1 Tax=Culex quinquefasciatus TaxID=7176 RepID=UPI0018E35702|nr:chymotrypsinogen 2 [Culex quinquefasciatus]